MEVVKRKARVEEQIEFMLPGIDASEDDRALFSSHNITSLSLVSQVISKNAYINMQYCQSYSRSIQLHEW